MQGRDVTVGHRRTKWIGALALWTIAIVDLLALPASAQSPFASLTGTWTGSGQVRFTNGASEAVKCRAYYTAKDAGSGLGLAILCASASNKIELRATLAYDGGKVTGEWNERTYNATGAVAGSASPGKMALTINGGGFSGSMAVGVTGGNQSVTISTSGIGMTGFNINLSKS